MVQPGVDHRHRQPAQQSDRWVETMPTLSAQHGIGDQVRRRVGPSDQTRQAGGQNEAFVAPGQICDGSSCEGLWMALTSSAATVRNLMLRRCEIVRRVANAVAGSQRRWVITIPIA